MRANGPPCLLNDRFPLVEPLLFPFEIWPLHILRPLPCSLIVWQSKPLDQILFAALILSADCNDSANSGPLGVDLSSQCLMFPDLSSSLEKSS